MKITEKQIAEWRELRNKGMESAIGEYTPAEFWEALDEIERLRAESRDRESKEKMKKPKIITLCGSTRFIETIAVMGYLLEKEGAIVLGLHFLPQSYFKGDDVVASHIAEKEGVAEHFDNLHLRKIDISDSIYVINVNGYIGESTRNEIDYAEKIGKSVTYLESIQ